MMTSGTRLIPMVGHAGLKVIISDLIICEKVSMLWLGSCHEIPLRLSVLSIRRFYRDMTRVYTTGVGRNMAQRYRLVINIQALRPHVAI